MSFPVVFLDIDGVLNHEELFELRRGKPYSLDDDDWLDKDCVVMLNRIVEETGARFVLSSAWRIIVGLKRTSAALRECGFIGDLFDETGKSYLMGFADQRAEEIHAWLNDHPEVRQWVVLDDNHVAVHPPYRMVQTHFSIGLTEPLVDRAIEVLKKVTP